MPHRTTPTSAPSVLPSRPPDTSSPAYRRALKHHLSTLSPAPPGSTSNSPPPQPTPFRTAEKYFKARFPPPDLQRAGVVDVALLDECRREEVERGWWRGSMAATEGAVREVGLWDDAASESEGEGSGIVPGTGRATSTNPRQRTRKRRAYTLPSHPGLVLLPAFLPPKAQRALVRTCLRDAARAPNETNLDTHYAVPAEGLWACARDRPRVVIVPRAGGADRLGSAGELGGNGNESAGGRRTLITNPPATASSLPALLTPKPPAPPSPFLRPALPGQLLPKLRWANVGASYHWGEKSYDLSRGVVRLPGAVRGWAGRAVRGVRWGEVFGGDGRGLRAAGDGEAGGEVGWESWADDYAPDAGIVNFYQLSSTLMGHVDHSELDGVRPLVSISLGHACVFLLGGATREERAPTALVLRSGDVLMMSAGCRRAVHGVPRVLEGTLPGWMWDELGEGAGERWEEWRPFAEYLATARINVNVRQVFPPGTEGEDGEHGGLSVV